MRGRWRWIALGLVLCACDGGAAPGAPCDVSADCGAGSSCAFGRCRAACDDDRACRVAPAGIDAATGAGTGRCVVDERGASGCTLTGRDDRCASAADCPGGLVCHDGECRNACGDAECPAGMRCAPRGGARICEWTTLSDAGPAPDGGDVPTGDAALPRLDAGALPDAGSAPSGWPESFPVECIPPPGETIGAPCDSDGDCDEGVCDRELTLELAAGVPPESLSVVHSPGGTCVSAVIDQDDPFRGFGACSLCERFVQTPAGRYACVDRCTIDAPVPRGGCREGYVCDPVIGGCVAGCRVDDECRLGRGGSSRGLGPPATCDVASGRCVDPDGAGGVGDPCSAHAECGPDLFCAAQFLSELHSRGACSEPPENLFGSFSGCEGFDGLCTRTCTSDAVCGDGARCAAAPYQETLVGRPARRLCLPSCTVGAEAPERRFGWTGGGEGCPPRFGCYPPGVCAPGAYNDVPADMPNVGDACFVEAQCWSPLGLGRCGEGGFGGGDATCWVTGCDSPLGGDACPADVGACVEGGCRRRCETPADCEGADACRTIAEERVCAPGCRADEECASGRCVVPIVGSDGFCDTGGPPPAGGCGLTTVPLDAPPDPDGWRRQIVRAPAAPTGDLCGVGISADGVSFTAPADGRLEIEVTGEGHYLAGVLDFTRCDRLGDPSLYDCEAPQTRSVRLVAGQTVSFAIVGTPEVSTRRTELRYRFVEERGLGESCAGDLGCEPGLECGALGGADRCVPSPVCGDGVPVATLDGLGAAQPDGSVQVLVEATGADRHAPSCEPGTGRGDLVIPLQSLRRERWIVEPTGGTVWTRAACGDAGTDRVCGAGGAPIVFDLAAGEAVDLMSEAAAAHDLTIRRRTLLGPGGTCAVMSVGAVPGVQCEPGTFCELDIWGNGTCGAADVGCGAGVGRTLIPTLPVGTTTLRVDTRFAPPPSFAGDASALCDAPPGEAVAILELRVEQRSSLELRNVLRAGSDTSPTWTLRSSCDAPAQTPCGPRLLERDSPLLEPGVTYYLLAFHPEPIEGTLEVVARLRPVQGPGEPCGGAFDGCHASLVCDGGTCRAPVCGDGAREGYEQCDDGGTAPGDGCDGACRVEGACGNGRLEPGEECDDTNADDGDGCSSACVIEFSADGGGDGCADAQRLTLVPVGETEVARGRAVRAGATDRMSPMPLPPLTCNIPPEPGAVDRVFIVEGHAGDAVRPIGTRGVVLFYNRLAITCESGPDLNCARAAMDDGADGCVTLPVDGDYIVVAEPMTDVFEFDIVLNGCTPP